MAIEHQKEITDPKLRRAALEDLVWSLLNTAEFVLNH
jgi:hypothetical protein